MLLGGGRRWRVAARGAIVAPSSISGRWAAKASGSSRWSPRSKQRHPDIRVRVQQIPWTAAHEKLLTAFAGDTLPDVCQLGNTWIAEFAALGALEDLTNRVAAAARSIRADDFFPGVWQGNVIGERVFGVPWYVDTRLMFYRKDLLAAAGHDEPPKSLGRVAAA